MFEIGPALRTARLRQRLDIESCGASTKIRTRYLQALEEDHFELLPERPYARAFLGTYARTLGLDPTPFLDEFDDRFPDDTGPEPPPGVGEPDRDESPAWVRPGVRMQASRPPRRVRFGAWTVWTAASVVGVALLVLAAGLDVRGGHRGAAPIRTDTAVSPRPASSLPPRASVAAPPRVLRLQLTGIGASGSWVAVRRLDAGGPMLYEGVLANGASMRFVSQTTLWIRVGWTPRLRASVDGRGVPLSGPTASFVVSRGGLRALP